MPQDKFPHKLGNKLYAVIRDKTARIAESGRLVCDDGTFVVACNQGLAAGVFCGGGGLAITTDIDASSIFDHYDECRQVGAVWVFWRDMPSPTYDRGRLTFAGGFHHVRWDDRDGKAYFWLGDLGTVGILHQSQEDQRPLNVLAATVLQPRPLARVPVGV